MEGLGRGHESDTHLVVEYHSMEIDIKRVDADTIARLLELPVMPTSATSLTFTRKAH